MRVLILTHSQFPRDDRIEKEVSSLISKGIEVTIVANARWTSERVSEYRGAEVLYLKMASPFGIPILDFRTLFRLVQRNHYDFIQVCDAPLGWVAMTLSAVFGPKLVYDAHEAWLLFPLFSERRSIGVSSTPVYFITEAALVRRSHKIITVSQGMKALFARYYKCPPAKVEVVRNLPSRVRMLQPLNSTRKSDPDMFLIVFFGGIDGGRRRELSQFIKAIGILKRTSKVRYVIKIVGGDPFLKAGPRELTALAEEQSVSDRVEFCGWLPWDEVLSIIASADLGLIGLDKNAYTDIALPNKLFQYMLLGVPILTSDLDEVRRLVGNGVSYYDDNDPESLARIIEGIQKDLPGTRTRALELRQQALRDLTWENEEEKYLRIFNR